MQHFKQTIQTLVSRSEEDTYADQELSMQHERYTVGEHVLSNDENRKVTGTIRIVRGKQDYHYILNDLQYLSIDRQV